MKNATMLTALLCIMTILPAALADSVLLKNGSMIEGTIIDEDDTMVTIKAGDAEIKVPKASISSQLDEISWQYHARQADSFYEQNNFTQAEFHLNKMAETGAPSHLINLARMQLDNGKKILDEKGIEGLQEYNAMLQNVLSDIYFQSQQGNYREALTHLKTFYDMNPDSLEILMLAAELAIESLAARMSVTDKEREEWHSKFNRMEELPEITFAEKPSVVDLPVMKTPEQLFIPLAHTTQLPLGLASLRQMYRDNEEIDLLILIASRIRQMNLPHAVMIDEPTLQQWAYVLWLANEAEKVYYEDRNQLSKEEADDIRAGISSAIAQNRNSRIDYLWSAVTQMAQEQAWGQEMQIAIESLRRLDPPPEILNELPQYEAENARKMEQALKHYQAMSRSMGPSSMDPWNLPKGEATVYRKGGYPLRKSSPNAQIIRVDPR